MLLLTATTDKFKLVTSSAASLDVHASFVDLSGTTVTPGKQNTAIALATTTDIVAAPGASTTRNLKTLHVRNKHASTANDVTIVFDQNGTDFELIKVTLGAGESLHYVEGVGFTRTVSNLLVIGSVAVVTLAADLSNATSTTAEVTGIRATVGSTGNYIFQYLLRYQATVATTGVKFDVNFTGTANSFQWVQMWSDVSATASTAVPDQDNIGAAGHVMGSFASRAKGTAGRGQTLSVDTANADLLMIIEGLMVVSTTGDLALWHASEVTATSTMKAGSSLILTKTG